MEGVLPLKDHPDANVIPSTIQETDSFQTIFKTYYTHVVQRIMRITRERAIAEDLAQEVFLKLYDQDLNQLRNIGGWLTQASIYAAYNYLRSEKRRIVRDEKIVSEVDMTEPSTEDQWLQQEEIEAVREALIELDERDRSLLLLKYSGFNYKELAQAVSVEASSVGTLLGRARRRFREYYQKKRGNDA